MKDPCKDCLSVNKFVDDYGYLCDLHCGKHSAYLNHQEGVKEVIDWIKTHQLIEPDKDSLTKFEPYYMIEAKELKEWEE
jgi:hypothetical protein